MKCEEDARMQSSRMCGSALSGYARYLPVEPDALAWGMHVIDGGFASVPPASPYPPERHPAGYMFSWARGRVLDEHQLVYITRGGGVFESRSAGRIRIEPGMVIVLFPGEWHRYRPLRSTGWDESWIGFDGQYARHLVDRFFPLAQPVYRVGNDDSLLRLFRDTVELLRETPPGYRHVMAAHVVEALARIRALAAASRHTSRQTERAIQQARVHLLAHATENVDLDRLARTVGMSYSRFRSAFRLHTGSSPRQYQIQIRLNQARDLLAGSGLAVAAIAERVGFSSVYYFSRLFKLKAGLPPAAFRRKHQKTIRP